MRGFPPLRRFAAAVLALLLVPLFSACANSAAAPSTPEPAAPTTASAPPIQTATEQPAPATPSPTPYPLTFTTPGSAVAEAFMSLPLNAPISTAIDLFGEPAAIYGQNGYVYRAIAGSENAQAALVYRFVKDKVGLECIAAPDGRI